jgi:hypothetical protein
MVAEVTRGGICFSLIAAVLGPGCFLADCSHTNVFKPNWPPHAKSHNGQTMAMGPFLTVAILYCTWRIDLSPNGIQLRQLLYLQAYTGSRHLLLISSQAACH